MGQRKRIKPSAGVRRIVNRLHAAERERFEAELAKIARHARDLRDRLSGEPFEQVWRTGYTVSEHDVKGHWMTIPKRRK